MGVRQSSNDVRPVGNSSNTWSSAMTLVPPPQPDCYAPVCTLAGRTDFYPRYSTSVDHD